MKGAEIMKKFRVIEIHEFEMEDESSYESEEDYEEAYAEKLSGEWIISCETIELE
jgi:hypothetical protein